jgi:hypothetical protein
VVNLEGLLSRYVAGGRLVDHLAQDETARVNTDDHNVIEYGFARTMGRTSTDFSIQDLREQAIRFDAHRPGLADSRVNWDRVEGHRQLLYAVFDGTIIVPADASDEHTARAEVLARYWHADTRGMIKGWLEAGYEPIFPDEVALLALAYADLGDDRARKHIDRLRSLPTAEADAIEAYLCWKQGKTKEAAVALDKALLRMRSSPWGLSHALELVCDMTVDITRQDPSQAARLYAALSRPLAVYVHESERLMSAHAVAAWIGPEILLETLDPFEPNVPWDESFLARRAQIYDATNHTLRGRARRDLELFRRWAAKEVRP